MAKKNHRHVVLKFFATSYSSAQLRYSLGKRKWVEYTMLELLLIKKVQVFLLILIRLSGFFLVAPVLSSRAVPIRLKIVLAVFVTLLLFPVVENSFSKPTLNLVDLVGLCFNELLLGLFLGFIPTIILAAFQLAGAIVGMEMGLGFANVLDPVSNYQLSILGQFELLIATLVFLLLEGHLLIIKSLAISFTRIPLGMFSFTNAIGNFFTDTLPTDLFYTALKISAPVLVASFIATISLAFASKIVPEINAFLIAFPIRILIGFLVLFITFPLVIDILFDYLMRYPFYIEPLFR